jgi:ATP-binding cassette, subfamily C, bacterial
LLINKKLIRLAAKSRKWILMTVLCSLSGLSVNIVTVIITSRLIEKLISGEYKGKDIILTGIAMATAAGVRFFLVYAGNRFSFRSSSYIKQHLREKVFEKLLQIETGYTRQTGTSSFITDVVDGIEALEVYFGRYLPQFFYSMLSPFVLFAVISRFYLTSALVLLLCVPLIPVSIMMVMKLARKLMGQFWESYEGLGSYFLESLQGLLTLKLFGRDGDRAEKLSTNAWNFRNVTMKVLGMQLNSITVMDTVAFTGAAAGILTAAAALSEGKIGVASTVAILLLATEFFVPLRVLGSSFHAAMNGVAASDKIFSLLETEAPDYLTGTAKMNIENPSFEVAFNEVCFSYDNERKVLKDVSFRIEHGSIYALVGESGCGKSTVAALMLGFISPDKGNILIDGTDIRNIHKQSLRTRITLVTGNSVVFTGTIRDNLLLGNPYATQEDMMKACDTAGLYDFIQGLPQGFDTITGERGSGLSGGQRQRLAVARALLYDADMFIFDEATSNVDIESETAIWKAIYSIAKKKTIFVISHRLSTVKNADLILVMKEGRIVEAGKHIELMNNRGIYRQMLEAQQQYEDFGERKGLI